MKVVFDTSVLVAAARSSHGASYALVNAIPSPEFQPCLSMSLYMEWQQVLTREENLSPGRTVEDFHGAEQLGVTVILPGDFLKLARQKP